MYIVEIDCSKYKHDCFIATETGEVIRDTFTFDNSESDQSKNVSSANIKMKINGQVPDYVVYKTSEAGWDKKLDEMRVTIPEGQELCIGIGTVAMHLRELAKCYKEAQIALEVGKVFDEEKFFAVDDDDEGVPF